MKIVHLVPTLSSGGAEKMLSQIVTKKQSKYDAIIITLLSGGIYRDIVLSSGINVIELRLNKPKNWRKGIQTLYKEFKKADIIQSWMYHADLISFVFGKILLNKKIIWGIRRSYIEKRHMKFLTFLIVKLNSYLSKYIDVVISCTEVGKENHQKVGYRNIVVIPNGFDIQKYKLNLERAYFENKTIKIINIGRWNVLKDHDNLFQCMKILKINGISWHLTLVGRGMEVANSELMELLNKYEILENVSLLGERDNIEEILHNSDIYISSSKSEGFPNVIGEAISSGLFCIGTNAGDTSYLLNGFGKVVPIENPNALANALMEAKELRKEETKYICRLAHENLYNNYEINNIVKKYEDIYLKLYGGKL